ncbi:transposase family protein [Streptomyces alanosinicus]|uniref:Transposase IS204/IS1001/IS1096/IS1165 zinc-finger domain-containing protein n=1 Tax=Streptomyces alanosinicus TaxID=68171 RepID=A0A918YPW3_9ACTN|nr:transposase family protein [Streptomyces alanosinicus]GHE10991.1 hypothetical protein GCM10010339_69010 [Streptomyces alanosinicus]
MCDELLDIVFPHLKLVQVERVFVEGGTVHVTSRTPEGRVVVCPDCRTSARRVHSRYQRHLADTAVAGRPVVIDLSVRRLFCDQRACSRCTFVEQVDGLTIRYQRRTRRCTASWWRLPWPWQAGPEPVSPRSSRWRSAVSR